LFFTELEADYLGEIELLMNTEIDVCDLPENIEISSQKIFEEMPKIAPERTGKKTIITEPKGEAFHEKKEKNRRVNLGGSYRREIAKKYKKPKTRGQKRK
jgi:ATP-dependent RNA helicase RhlE